MITGDLNALALLSLITDLYSECSRRDMQIRQLESLVIELREEIASSTHSLDDSEPSGDPGASTT